MSTIHELSGVCAERNRNPEEQRRRLIALLESGADIRATDKNGVTALHHAVRFRNPTAVRTLIEQGTLKGVRAHSKGSELFINHSDPNGV
jgi:ankyrin repeat protein